jgi:hypothetical protein
MPSATVGIVLTTKSRIILNARRRAKGNCQIGKSLRLGWRSSAGLLLRHCGSDSIGVSHEDAFLACHDGLSLVRVLSAGVVLAQSTRNTGSETITAGPPAAAPAATATAPAAAPTTTTTTEPAKSPKKKKVSKMTRQQEIDRSLDSGTAPARYRNSVPKEYQQYVPFEKR